MTRYTYLRVGVVVVGSTSDVCGSEFGLAPPEQWPTRFAERWYHASLGAQCTV